jgi:glycosyltransferase involved in cell wall biosynthesis
LFRKEEIKKIGRNGIMGVKDNIARELYWKKYKKTLSRYKQARRIIAISKSSKKDILKYIPEISKNDVSVTYLGVDSLSNIDHTQKISSKIKFILRHQYLLYVGGIDTRKNITKLLSDFFELKKDYPNMKAVFIGKEFGLTGQLDALGWNRILAQHKQDKDSILIPGYVNDAELRELYKNAIAFVFPSRYEGFGLPVLEAMQYGCPVIAYNKSSIPEVAGKASLLLKDGTSLIPGIKKIIEEPATRNRLVKYGKERVVSFSWEKTALEVYSTIKLIVGSN